MTLFTAERQAGHPIHIFTSNKGICVHGSRGKSVFAAAAAAKEGIIQSLNPFEPLMAK